MITKRHNLVCRMILEAISKTGSLGSCIVSKDIGSNERMSMLNPQFPETAESRIVPEWLFPPRFPDKDRYTSSRPDFVLVTPIAAKTHKQQTNVGGWVLWSGRGLAAKLVHTRRALSSTVIDSHQEPVSGQACNPPDPHWFFLPFHGGGALRYSVPKWLLFLK